MAETSKGPFKFFAKHMMAEDLDYDAGERTICDSTGCAIADVRMTFKEGQARRIERLEEALREAQGCLLRIILHLGHSAQTDVMQTQAKIDAALKPSEAQEGKDGE